MIGDRAAIAIIPARSGSKGLARKNIRALCGKPLLVWSIEAALASRHLDETMVTTDSEEIAAIARQHGANVPFLRPAELATDTASSFDVVVHTLDFYEKHLSRRFDYVMLLEPTSPLREKTDIDNMLSLLAEKHDRFDSVVSIGQVAEHPRIVKRTVGDSLEPFCPELKPGGRRQDNEPAYFPYGVGYLAKTSALLSEKTFYTARCTYYQLKRYQAYEIDDLYDFLCVESVMKHEWKLR